jgi:chromosome segregation ATPase
MSCEKELERARLEKSAALTELNQLSLEIPKYQRELERLGGEIEKLKSEKTELLARIEAHRLVCPNPQHERTTHPTGDDVPKS